MKEWYSAVDLMGLPGLPSSERRVRDHAQKYAWRSQPRSGRGGGLEYALTSLPAETQVALLAAESRALLADVPQPLPPPKPLRAEVDEAIKAAGDARAATLYGKARDRFDAKMALLEQFRGLDGSALIAALVEAGQPASLATIHRWRKATEQLGLSAIAGRYGHREGAGLIDTQPQLAAALRALLTEKPHISTKHALEFLHARIPDARHPSLKTVDRWLKNWKNDNHELFTRLSNPDAWKSKYQASFGDASAAITRLNEEWQADSTPADLLLKDGRHSLIVLLDVYSRRLLIHVSKTSTAAAIAHVLRRGLIDWGVPERLKTDNGQDYVAAHITRILQALNIDHQRCAPFQPQGKGHVERAIGTFNHDVLELLPGYIGHNVADRQAIRERQQFADQLYTKNAKTELPLTAAELQTIVDRWCNDYHNRPHSGLNGQRPLEIEAAWREPVRRITDPRQLDLLLARVPGKDGWRTIQKATGITVDKFEYLAVEAALYIKQRVRVLYDPEEADRVYVFDDKSGYLFTAVCPELTGINRNDLAAHAKNGQQKTLQSAAKAARAEAKTFDLKTAAEDILAHRESQNRTLVAFPTPTVDYTTPHLDGIAAALIGETALTSPTTTTLPNPPLQKGGANAVSGGISGGGEPAKPKAKVIVFETMNAAMRALFLRAMAGQAEPGDAQFVAAYYRETRKPGGFESEMIEREGWERFLAWKTATLAQAAAETAAQAAAQATTQTQTA